LASLLCTALLVPDLPPLAAVLFTVKPDLISIEVFEECEEGEEG
jgi:hypothetical protein